MAFVKSQRLSYDIPHEALQATVWVKLGGTTMLSSRKNIILSGFFST